MLPGTNSTSSIWNMFSMSSTSSTLSTSCAHGFWSLHVLEEPSSCADVFLFALTNHYGLNHTLQIRLWLSGPRGTSARSGTRISGLGYSDSRTKCNNSNRGHYANMKRRKLENQCFSSQCKTNAKCAAVFCREFRKRGYLHLQVPRRKSWAIPRLFVCLAGVSRASGFAHPRKDASNASVETVLGCFYRCQESTRGKLNAQIEVNTKTKRLTMKWLACEGRDIEEIKSGWSEGSECFWKTNSARKR